MSTFTRKLHILLGDKGLRTSILFTLGMLIVFRFLGTIPVPGVDPSVLQQFLQQNEFFSFLNLFFIFLI